MEIYCGNYVKVRRKTMRKLRLGSSRVWFLLLFWMVVSWTSFGFVFEVSEQFLSRPMIAPPPSKGNFM